MSTNWHNDPHKFKLDGIRARRCECGRGVNAAIHRSIVPSTNDLTDNDMSILELAQIGAVAVQKWQDQITAMDAERQEAFAESEKMADEIEGYSTQLQQLCSAVRAEHQLQHALPWTYCRAFPCEVARRVITDNEWTIKLG